ncbi:HEPN domain-containing protein [Sorangium sp. So ce145]|uniref:HEPN domain-containing protein n=1 Tax=Sorangium sp. So ce145 TaxID=3133285 RepID=UPI003F63D4BB
MKARPTLPNGINAGDPMARSPKLEHVRSKVQTRGDIREVGSKYLSRLHPVVHHMHQVLGRHSDDKSSLQIGTRQYVIALAGHLETFFRDIFRYILENNPEVYNQIVQGEHIRVPVERDLAAHGVNRHDFVAEAFTLQSAGSIASALDPLFSPKGFRFAVEHSQLEYAVPARSAMGRGFPLSAFPDWWQDLSKILDLRHEFAHDANSTASVDAFEMARLESLAVLLPQYVTIMVGAVRLVAGSPCHEELPVMLLVEDLLANDWQIVPTSDLSTDAAQQPAAPDEAGSRAPRGNPPRG